jgi:hypothetical protein
VKRLSEGVFKPRRSLPEYFGELQSPPYQPKPKPVDEELPNISRFDTSSTVTTIPTGFARFSFSSRKQRSRASKLPISDPYEERYKRYRGFYGIESTTIYRRGGDQILENKRKGSLASHNTIIEEGEAEAEEDVEGQGSHDDQNGGYAIQQ